MRAETPELLAFLPAAGPLVTLAEDGKSIALRLDLDHGDVTGDHLVGLSLGEAARLLAEISAAMQGALLEVDRQCVARLRGELEAAALDALAKQVKP